MTDQALITQFQNGDSKEAAFTQLVKCHQTQVYYQIKKMVLEHADADDIAQAVWIKVWNKLDGFKQESAFSTWLFRIAYNETLNFIAQKKRLTAHQRFVFMLRYYDDFDYEKIASITGTTVGGAKANYHQAVKKMTTLLQTF